MMCLTLHQPWASLLVYGIKRVEGRGWTTDFRGRLWIHAGNLKWRSNSVAAKEPDPYVITLCEKKYREIYRQHKVEDKLEFPKHYPTSALLGYVDVIDVVSFETLLALPFPETVYLSKEAEK